ncbi:MAG: hypothetical protein HKN13_03700, partial [Rhodothermales bacterium]|nr:hypothetical protein [Rhodothermales bacterium]
EQSMEVVLAGELAPGRRMYTLYLPLYNGVDSLEVGVEEGAALEPLDRRTEKPILFYGTSIMQGACASRPGMAITAILSRRLQMPIINLGFSGHGRMDPEIADLMAELDPAIFVIDCLPNMNASLIGDNAMPLVRKLRQARPDIPVLLVEDRAYTNAPFFP